MQCLLLLDLRRAQRDWQGSVLAHRFAGGEPFRDRWPVARVIGQRGVPDRWNLRPSCTGAYFYNRVTGRSHADPFGAGMRHRFQASTAWSAARTRATLRPKRG